MSCCSFFRRMRPPFPFGLVPPFAFTKRASSGMVTGSPFASVARQMR